MLTAGRTSKELARRVTGPPKDGDLLSALEFGLAAKILDRTLTDGNRTEYLKLKRSMQGNPLLQRMRNRYTIDYIMW